MDKILIIVESPAKAHKIQEFLGKNYTVLASYGHIADLAKGGKHGIGINIEKDFKPHYVLIDDKVQVLDNILDAAKKSNSILLCGDPDREGTSICWHIKERLDGIDIPIKRVKFHEITKKAILKAIKSPEDINMNTVHSQEARRILDRIVGFMVSPFLMNFFGSNLSAGRVQSVVTRMIIDREKEIEKFVPEDYWIIQVNLSKNNQEGFITKYAGKLNNLQLSENIKNKLSIPNAKFIVSEVIAEEEKKSPPPPLITSSLQRIMSQKYGFNAGRTMKAAQALYEAGHCTYIRTDSARTEPDALKEVRQWLDDNQYEVPKRINQYKNKDSAQDAHECIRPSDLLLLPQDNFLIANPDEKLVYEIIWKYFIASQMMPAIYNTLKITAYLENNKNIEVKASGKALKSKGFLEILGINDDSKIDIPNLNKGDVLFLFGDNPVKMDKKQTQPLPRYSEDKLIKELVNKNIGRPSTYSELLEKITARNYVEKKGNVYHATELGKKVTDILSGFFTFMNYDFTALMEKELDEIEAGKITHLDVLKKFYAIFKKELGEAYINYGGSICEKCQSPMAIRISKTSEKFLGCTNWPKCSNAKSLKIDKNVA